MLKLGSDHLYVLTLIWVIITKSRYLLTQPLDSKVICKIRSLQLFTQSHNQGWASLPDAGIWTWFELAILENSMSPGPRVKDGIELVWTSHRQNSLSKKLQWEGNVITVRMCARFDLWKIKASVGYMVIEIGDTEVCQEPVNYGPEIGKVKIMAEVVQGFNELTSAAYKPNLPDGNIRADALSDKKIPLRVLSLDGGGMRGLLSLHILRRVMGQAHPGRKPCEVFDMIGGTSTGGLIAIMLGCLQMTVDECIDQYEKLGDQVFESGLLGKTADFFRNKTYYDGEVLAQEIKKIIKKKLGNDDIKMRDVQSSCRVFVLAVRKDAANNRAPVFLRSYDNKNDLTLVPKIKLWEAARATSAAPAYFPSIEIDKYHLVDGGLGANNPVGWLWSEVLSVFGPNRPTSCFLSIGTGIPANEPLVDPGVMGSHAVEKSFASIATNSEISHILFRVLIDAFAPRPMIPKYCRLNVGVAVPAWEDEKGWGLWKRTEHHLDNYKSVPDLDDTKGVKDFVEMTRAYIREDEIRKSVQYLTAVVEA
ncbi:FabD/lysophospholipase-like protein [Aspergillus costaricaensis CBS 115574]|uniref:FabD/lysophospholipase-like protein n=1 Tax=Aspergillus costaricaensis CBS 115574 TaxID=1448317 RepID=A0ACD1I6J8_9EURO|nr:FabD/lysophospholipase-like protein [Aspergillus costaricaensis CBS 115574]RAK85941.1 FabD/lysophospholipase-like protein [Aspergillus costaricaensis CBS 115574]